MKFIHNKNEYELILLTTAGSRLYGNATPESDWDYRGVFISSKESKLGLLNKVEQLEGIDVYNSLTKAGIKLEFTDDIVIYELNRFAQLAIDNNPNIIDILCCDYNKDTCVYYNEKGKELIDNNTLFISSKLKFTFSGYAISQLQRIKGHNKYINQFPNTDEILRLLEKTFKEGKIGFNWICDNFGGQVAEKITNETPQTPQNNTKMYLNGSWYSWEDFCLRYKNSEIDFNKYRIPRLIDYCYPKSIKSQKLEMKSWAISPPNSGLAYEGLSIEKLLHTRASFREISPSVLAIYTNGNGIFSKEGNIKSNEPQEVGEFICLLSIDKMKYKSDKDYIVKLWNWKCHRNESRGLLEEKHGFDTKHASHLVRLMQGAKNILLDCTYNPTLTGQDLQLVKDVRAGEYTYDWIINYSEKLDKELNELYKTTKLQKKPNIKSINDIILKLQK